MDQNLIRLRCVKVDNKLRVRIISKGYNPNANSQFPKNIREEGREYLVPAADISFSESPQHKFFYRVKKANVQIVDQAINDLTVDQQKLVKDLTIYEDEDENLCCICLEAQKESIFHPCGHYYCCNKCATAMKDKKQPCPICRAPIGQIVGHDRLQ